MHLQPTGRAHTEGDQVVTVPDAGVMFTGDLVETGQFSIFLVPPYETNVSGLGWIAVMQRLIGESPPGRGARSRGHWRPQLLGGVRDYLAGLRDETWQRRDAGMGEQTIAEQVRAVMTERHPDWAQPEWVERGVCCLYSEHAA